MPQKISQCGRQPLESGLRCRALHTESGQLFITGPVEAEELAQWQLDEGLRSFRPPVRQKEALITITGMKHGQVFVARFDETIVGYVTFHVPEDFERWGQSSLNALSNWELLRLAPLGGSTALAKH